MAEYKFMNKFNMMNVKKNIMNIFKPDNTKTRWLFTWFWCFIVMHCRQMGYLRTSRTNEYEFDCKICCIPLFSILLTLLFVVLHVRLMHYCLITKAWKYGPYLLGNIFSRNYMLRQFCLKLTFTGKRMVASFRHYHIHRFVT